MIAGGTVGAILIGFSNIIWISVLLSALSDLLCGQGSCENCRCHRWCDRCGYPRHMQNSGTIVGGLLL